MSHILLVAIGGGLGASARYLTNLAALRLAGPHFPWGTLTVNILGSFAMGVLIAFFARRTGTSMELRSFLTTGFLGGFDQGFQCRQQSLLKQGRQGFTGGIARIEHGQQAAPGRGENDMAL